MVHFKEVCFVKMLFPKRVPIMREIHISLWHQNPLHFVSIQANFMLLLMSEHRSKKSHRAFDKITFLFKVFFFSKYCIHCAHITNAQRLIDLNRCYIAHTHSLSLSVTVILIRFQLSIYSNGTSTHTLM